MDYSVIYDMPEAEYHALDYASASKIKQVIKSPSHFKNSGSFSVTPDMEMGTAFHSVILEPEKKGVFYSEDVRSNGKIYKADVEANPDKLVLTSQRGILLDLMVSKLKGTEVHKRMLAGKGAAEVTVIGQIDNTPVKCRIDRIKFIKLAQVAASIIYDLKTIATMPSDEAGFYREIIRWGYHIQAAWYLDMARAAGLNPKMFYFVFVEKTAPYHYFVVHLSEWMLEEGRRLAYKGFDRYVECMESGEWPSPFEELGVPSLCIDKPEWMN